jgi:uncharacterized membrane protein
MTIDSLAARLAALERRLERIEIRLGLTAPAAAPDAAVSAAAAATPAAPARVAAPPAGREGASAGAGVVTNLLGWGGSIALVLAASYLVRLAIDTGWLTPIRQVLLASLGGFALIGTGFALRDSQRQYASLLPAAGIVILFICVYGAHLYYGLVGSAGAALGVLALCVGALILCRVFSSDLYALFAVAGSYSAPFLLPSLRGSVIDLALYFSAWAVIFSQFAIWHGRRVIYLLALYLALIGFDILWRQHASQQWLVALLFHGAQFVVFGLATALFSIRRNEPLGHGAVLAHVPPLLLFYFIEYAILDRHVPVMAPWVAVASLAVMAGVYALARARTAAPLPGGQLLLGSYLALVLFHAGYVESVPDRWTPWFALALLPCGLALWRVTAGAEGRWPVAAAIAVIFAVNYLRVVLDIGARDVPAQPLLSVAYAVLLYTGYAFSRGAGHVGGPGAVALYLGHMSSMAAALQRVDRDIVESVCWGLLALACLAIALWRRDRVLGQSALLMFGLSAAKVLLYDLSGASDLTRIASLVVLGITFYAGGILYQRVLKSSLDIPAA